MTLPTRLLSLVVACPLLGAGCGEPAPAAPDYPDGTVLVVGERPILAAEVDEWLPSIELIEPGRSRAGQRRLALTNIVLHRAIAAQLDPAAHAEARRQAEEARARLVAGEALPADGPQIEEVVEGYWKVLGIDAWQLARHAPIGEWSEVQESTAYFYVQRVLGRDPEPWTKDQGAHVERILFPYLDEEHAFDLITEAETITPLAIVDPAWGELVPAHYQYRMGVEPRSTRETPPTRAE